MYKPKWNFKIPEQGPTLFQKVKMEVVRSTNNFQIGFDGTLTPLQLGVLCSPRPVREYEVVLADLLQNKDVIGMIKHMVFKNALLNEKATRKRKLLDLHENT